MHKPIWHTNVSLKLINENSETSLILNTKEEMNALKQKLSFSSSSLNFKNATAA